MDALIKVALVLALAWGTTMTYKYVQLVDDRAYLRGRCEMLEYNLEMTEQYPYTRRGK